MNVKNRDKDWKNLITKIGTTDFYMFKKMTDDIDNNKKIIDDNKKITYAYPFREISKNINIREEVKKINDSFFKKSFEKKQTTSKKSLPDSFFKEAIKLEMESYFNTLYKKEIEEREKYIKYLEKELKDAHDQTKNIFIKVSKR